MKKAQLLENGFVIAEYEYEVSSASIDGKIHTPYTWAGANNEPLDYQFFAEAYIKWDGCSHFHFHGERYNSKDEKGNDSYYHICGVNDYLRFIKVLTFSLEVAAHEIGDRFYEKEELESLRKIGILNKCEIRYL